MQILRDEKVYKYSLYFEKLDLVINLTIGKYLNVKNGATASRHSVLPGIFWLELCNTVSHRASQWVTVGHRVSAGHCASVIGGTDRPDYSSAHATTNPSFFATDAATDISPQHRHLTRNRDISIPLFPLSIGCELRRYHNISQCSSIVD